MKKFIQTLRNSLFIRLFGIFAVTLILLLVILGNTVDKITDDVASDVLLTSKEPISLLVNGGIDGFISEIGTPPNLDKAAAFADQLPINIIIIGPGLNWHSEDTGININRFRQRYVISNQLHMVQYRDRYGLKITKDAFTFYIINEQRFWTDQQRHILYLAIILILTVLVLNYLAVQRLLKPIRLLQQGAKKISQGNLDYRVNLDRSDELGQLTVSINHMADSLKEMLEAKQQLLLAVSHELRTPITRAKVQLEMLDNEKIKQSLKDDINELDLLVSELLEAERLNSQHAKLNLEAFSLAELVNNTVRQYWPNNTLINLQTTTNNETMLLDPLRISLLLRNVINNALHYSDQQSITISVYEEHNDWVIAVKDQGQGIAAQHIPHLTEPFYRADSARQRHTGGFGLGLHLCRLIVEAHNGLLYIESEEGVGTTISMSFTKKQHEEKMQ